MLIISEIPRNIPAANLNDGDSWRCITGARIVALNPDKPAKPLLLTEDLYSACSPDISYDGRYMLFAAQRDEGEFWQIWEMDLKKLTKRKITAYNENCADPVYLPGYRFVFSKLSQNDTVQSGYALITCNLDGSDSRQVTFHPHVNLATTILKDGRLLTLSKKLNPKQEEQIYMVLRPDGTKADMFYKGNEGSTLLSRPREDANRRILFIESENGNTEGGDVVSIGYNRPLHSRISLTAGSGHVFRSVLPLPSGKLLVSGRVKESDHYILYEFDPENKVLGPAVYDNLGYNVLEALRAEAYTRPKKLPSEVDMGVKTGLLMCQNINILRTQPSDNLLSIPKAVKIEVLGIDSTMGVVEIEKDGSFQLKITADTPFQIRTLDENNKVLQGPCAWIWLRPNERRGCVGCHEDPELVPDNIVPFAVKKAPIILPKHISGVSEKEIELE